MKTNENTIEIFEVENLRSKIPLFLKLISVQRSNKGVIAFKFETQDDALRFLYYLHNQKYTTIEYHECIVSAKAEEMDGLILYNTLKWILSVKKEVIG